MYKHSVADYSQVPPCNVPEEKPHQTSLTFFFSLNIRTWERLAQILKHLNLHFAAADTRTNMFLFTPKQAHLSHGQQSILSKRLHLNSTTDSKGRQGEQCSDFRSKDTAKEGGREGGRGGSGHCNDSVI